MSLCLRHTLRKANGTKLTTGLTSDVLLVLSEAVLVISKAVIVSRCALHHRRLDTWPSVACLEKTTAQIDYEHDYDYAHDSQNSVSYLSAIPS